jgi:hypothetical protein
MSVLPPADEITIMRIGFSGKAASAEVQTKDVAPMHAANRRSK